MTNKQLPQSPAGEFVMFSSENGQVRIECRFEGDTLWLSQAMIGELYGKAKGTISEHIKNIFAEGELDEDAVVRFYRTTAADGKSYNVQFFSLPLVLAVGYRVRSARGTQFRKWATRTHQFLQFNDCEVLVKAGRVSKQQADDKAHVEYERYASQQRHLKEQQGEQDIEALLQWQRTQRGKDQQ